MKTALYARVSTRDKNQDPELQLAPLREFCHSKGWAIAAEFVDKAPGSKDSRPALDQLMDAARKRQFGAVAVWKFDRFARSVLHLLKTLEMFDHLRIDFVSLTEKVDTSSPIGKLVFTVLGAVAELERNLISERVREGMKNARRKGIPVGRPRKAVDLRKLASLASAGTPGREISRRMGLSPSYVFRALKGLAERKAGFVEKEGFSCH